MAAAYVTPSAAAAAAAAGYLHSHRVNFCANDKATLLKENVINKILVVTDDAKIITMMTLWILKCKWLCVKYDV